MANTPYGIRASRGPRNIIRRVETEAEQEQLVDQFEADGWTVERDERDPGPSYSERRFQEDAARAYALDEARSRVRLDQ